MPAARRIFPAPRSSRPLHPPSLRPSPLVPPSPGGGGRRGGRGGGRAGPGVGSAGDRPPAGDRAPPGAFPPRRCAATGSGTAGKAGGEGGSGGPRRRHRGGGSTLPECYSPPAAALAESRGRGSQTCRRALPPPGALPRGGAPARGRSPRGRAGVHPPRPRPGSGSLGGPGRPSHGATALPPRPASNRVGRGGADCPQCAPGGSRRRARGGFSVTPVGEASARGQRRCRPPTRPVLKHGPRSLTRARVRGSHESRRGAMKVKAALAGGRGGIPRPLQSAEGAPPARLARRAGEVEHERTC